VVSLELNTLDLAAFLRQVLICHHHTTRATNLSEILMERPILQVHGAGTTTIARRRWRGGLEHITSNSLVQQPLQTLVQSSSVLCEHDANMKASEGESSKEKARKMFLAFSWQQIFQQNVGRFSF
jgi:hypothetical protein